MSKTKNDAQDREFMRSLYREVDNRICDTIGDHQGSLAIGFILSYSAGPEIFDKYGLFPGLFIHGQAESGKTKLTEWLLHLRGYNKSAGIGLLKGSSTGLQCMCENYSNEPVWADEYRNGKVSEEKEAVLRDAYNRQPAVKWTAGQQQRVMRTSFVVSGESTSSDAATRSRFLHVQVSASKRRANHIGWMDANKRKFFAIGRFTLENRSEFVVWLDYYLKLWLGYRELAEINERERMVHGICYGSWMAMCQMLQSHDAQEVLALKTFTIAHTKGGAEDVTGETNVMVFLRDFLTAFLAEAIPEYSVDFEETWLEHPPDKPNQTTGHKSISIFLAHQVCYDHTLIFLRKQGRSMVLSHKDLQAQLSQLPCWIGGNPQKRMGTPGEKANMRCWGFRLDQMPGGLGYLPCTDEKYAEYLQHPEKGDPREGSFYAIVARLRKRRDNSCGDRS